MIKFSRNSLISRRRALQIGIGSVTTLAVLSFGNLKALSYLIYTLTDLKKNKTSNLRSFKVSGKSSLRQRARSKGLIYGIFPEYLTFKDNRKFTETLQREADLIVAGVYWDQIRPTVDTFNFKTPDYFTDFATKNKMLMRGHPLVWYQGMPPWVKETLTSQNAKKILTNHIETVVKRYAGKMHSWDVVNEAIHYQGDISELRKDIWLKTLGPDYIDLAFRTTARYDPKAMLVYNETDVEYSELQQNTVLKLLEGLKSKGTPIHALGIQSHLEAHKKFNPKTFTKFLNNVADLGLKIMITELDVIDQKLPKDIGKRDRIIAGIYEDYLTAALSEKNVISVITWGLSDRHTWLNQHLPRPDKAFSRPLPLDRDLKPKLAWNAIARAFDRAPKR